LPNIFWEFVRHIFNNIRSLIPGCRPKNKKSFAGLLQILAHGLSAAPSAVTRQSKTATTTPLWLQQQQRQQQQQLAAAVQQYMVV
jgi:hypothetical protein